MFAPAIGIPEDPVTGNANGPLGAYLVHHNILEAPDGFIAFKGKQRVLVVFGFLGLASVSLTRGDTWTKKADMPTARLGLVTSVVKGRIYAVAGANVTNIISTLEEYDPETNTRTERVNSPTKRLGIAASVMNEKIYAIGGSVTAPPSHPGISTLEEYTP